MTTASRTLTIKLLCRSLPPISAEEGQIEIGIQDKDQAVYAVQKLADGSFVYQCDVTVRPDQATQKPAFFGPFVHGTPMSRFLYLSWKRGADAEALWLRRVKMPLSAVTWDLIEGNDVLEADITGRKPHLSVPVLWHVGLPARG